MYFTRSHATLAIVVVMTLAAGSVGAQEHKMKKGESHEMGEHAASPWKEMDAFHMVLGATYHPAAKGDLAPLKANAASLAAKAKAWNASTPPAACASSESRETVSWVANSAAKLAQQAAKGASDGELTTAITALHDRFESMEKLCAAHHDKKEMKH